LKVEGGIQMANFKKEAIELLDAIGGKENIKAVTHCMTRMRLVLHDTE
jgi:PTS system trehalose-specific IIC component